jgi:hypothetical protein
MDLPKINQPNLTAYFDKERGISHVVYRGNMDSGMTIVIYRWIFEMANYLEADDVRGSIYDFREVTDFQSYSLSAVQRESRNLNVTLDVSSIPVALLVTNKLQETMVRVAMQVTPQEYRKRIVFSEAEAIAFFEEWHSQEDDTTAV